MPIEARSPKGMEEEDRKDSGFGENTTVENSKDENRQSQIETQQTRLSEAKPSEQSPSSTSDCPKGYQQSSRKSNASAFQPSSRPPSSRHPNSSRRISTQPNPSSCSRRSSFLIHHPSQTYNGRPRLPQRRNSTAHPRTYFHNTTTAHHSHARALFQSLDSSLASRSDAFPSRPRDHLTSASSPTSLASTKNTAQHSSSSTLVNVGKPQPQRSYSNYVPATTIDWTLPATRQRQYEEIAKSSRGIRGLLRRLTSILLRRGSERTKFYDEKGSDAGSVRRYRLDVNDDDSDVDERAGSVRITVAKKERDQGIERKMEKATRSCFGLSRND